ncbi:glycosyltransferase family 2 protein [bacterium]|nr:glycosyltransferase family 2 protein [bacterium]
MISVIIPVYNEEAAIGSTVQEIKQVLKKNHLDQGSEIIIVNDGSTDQTGPIIAKLAVKIITNPHNMGYGFSLKRGILAAKNDTIVITDADCTYPFSYVPQLLAQKKAGFDLIVGARTGKYYQQSFLKRIFRRFLKILVEFVTNKKIQDINSGLRVFDKSLAIQYFPRLCNTFSFTTSQTLAYLMNNHFVTYVDIPYHKREGKSKVKLIRDSLVSLRYILESCVYYNPLKIFDILSLFCLILSALGFFLSYFIHLHVGNILGIGGLLLSFIIFSLGLIAVLLKQIMDKKNESL